MWVFVLIIIILYLFYSFFGAAGIPIAIISGIVLFIVLGVTASNKQSEDAGIMKANEEKIKQGMFDGFVPNKKIGPERDNYNYYWAVYVDETSKRVMFADLFRDNKTVFRFDEIIECSILEDGSTIQSGGVGRAVAGSIIAGGVGAVVGATTAKSESVTRTMSIRVVTTNIQCALFELPIIGTETKRDTDKYRSYMKFAQEVYATLVSIMDLVKKESTVSVPSSAPTPELPQSQRENIRKLTELRSVGVLTEAEYTEKIARILDEENAT